MSPILISENAQMTSPHRHKAMPEESNEIPPQYFAYSERSGHRCLSTCSALVRSCGIVNAIDLHATPARWQDLQLPDHTVSMVTKAEAMEIWKYTGRCDHKKLVADLRAKLSQQNNANPSHEEGGKDQL